MLRFDDHKNQKRKMKGRSVLVALCLVFLGTGIVISVLGVNTLQNAKASLSWPKARGQVVESIVKRRRSESTTGRNQRTKTTYKATVFYDYSVDGTEYSSDKISFGDYSSSSPSHARRIVNRYPKGKTVEVYYNPAKPQVAVLEPGASWSSYMPLGLGVFFATAGGAVLAGSIIGKTRGGRRNGSVEPSNTSDSA